MSLFSFYKLSFIVAALSSASLSVIGKHYYSRAKILDVFLLSQMSLLGNLLSKLFLHSYNSTIVSVSSSFIFFIIGAFFLHRLKLTNSEKGTFMVGGYLFLISLQYLLIGYFPQLDSHMSIGFFGNMVTASKYENLLIISVFSGFIGSYFLRKKSINRNTLEINILNKSKESKFELILFCIPLIISLYGLGFIYTMSFLLLPSLIVGRHFSTEQRAIIGAAFLSLIASILGLSFSILFERLSTSSLQIALLFTILTIFSWLTRRNTKTKIT